MGMIPFMGGIAYTIYISSLYYLYDEEISGSDGYVDCRKYAYLCIPLTGGLTNLRYLDYQPNWRARRCMGYSVNKTVVARSHL